MICNYKSVYDKKLLTDVCDHLGNRWLDYIEARLAVSLHKIYGWGYNRIGDMFDGVSAKLSDYMSLYASDGEDIWETTLTANFSLERQLRDIGVDLFEVNLTVADHFNDYWRNKRDTEQHDFRVQWIRTMENKLYVYWGVLFLWLNERHGFGAVRLMRLYRDMREAYVKFAEAYLMCTDKHNRQLVRMVEDIVKEAKAICKEEEPEKAFISVEEFINNKNKYLIKGVAR